MLLLKLLILFCLYQVIHKQKPLRSSSIRQEPLQFSRVYMAACGRHLKRVHRDLNIRGCLWQALEESTQRPQHTWLLGAGTWREYTETSTYMAAWGRHLKRVHRDLNIHGCLGQALEESTQRPQHTWLLGAATWREYTETSTCMAAWGRHLKRVHRDLNMHGCFGQALEESTQRPQHTWLLGAGTWREYTETSTYMAAWGRHLKRVHRELNIHGCLGQPLEESTQGPQHTWLLGAATWREYTETSTYMAAWGRHLKRVHRDLNIHGCLGQPLEESTQRPQHTWLLGAGTWREYTETSTYMAAWSSHLKRVHRDLNMHGCLGQALEESTQRPQHAWLLWAGTWREYTETSTYMAAWGRHLKRVHRDLNIHGCLGQALEESTQRTQHTWLLGAATWREYTGTSTYMAAWGSHLKRVHRDLNIHGCLGQALEESTQRPKHTWLLGAATWREYTETSTYMAAWGSHLKSEHI